jgi:hypothetical protein
MSRDYDDEYDDHDEARGEPVGDDVAPAPSSKTSVPGALMMATGVVNLLIAVGGFLFGSYVQKMPDAEFERALQQQDPAQRKQLEESGYGVKELRNIYVRGGYGGGALWLLGALVSIIGGVCMLARKARWLAILAAVNTALPCVTSPCCLLGLPIGIWALVVLFQPDVKNAFR